ncbi:uncharacterized protein LOC129709591 [Leucoraja erinacea]|uniref:uncharacterized protein LOC129709591 n=1 Tax=Leucoraja erinaceus TaxID=7782 RepID=UPI0024576546|nr:uncharacterized protein LOC129709591 [Leucoraja erinacea]
MEPVDKQKQLRAALVNRLSEGVIGDLADAMQEAEVINKSEYEDIRQENKTTINKARCLIGIVWGKGSRAIEKLIQSLNKTDPELCYHLNISSKENKRVPTAPPAPVIEEWNTPRPEPPTPPVVLSPGDWTTPSPQWQNNELSQMAGRPAVGSGWAVPQDLYGGIIPTKPTVTHGAAAQSCRQFVKTNVSIQPLFSMGTSVQGGKTPRRAAEQKESGKGKPVGRGAPKQKRAGVRGPKEESRGPKEESLESQRRKLES